jgi:hypothetical protein
VLFIAKKFSGLKTLAVTSERSCDNCNIIRIGAIIIGKCFYWKSRSVFLDNFTVERKEVGLSERSGIGERSGRIERLAHFPLLTPTLAL